MFNTPLTETEKEFNDYLHKSNPDLMAKAYKLFTRKAKFYGGLYGYEYKGYSSFNKDIFTLARKFENTFAQINGITNPNK